MSAREMTPTTSSAWRRADAGPRALSSAPPPLSCLAVSLPPLQQGATNRTLLPPPIGPTSRLTYTGVMPVPRTADPWRDTDVIDTRAPRFNQAVVGIVALAGALLGWPLLWALMGAQLLIGLTLGRRFCLTCLAYFELIQPRFGEGELEDSRPPRLANMIGFVFLGAAALTWWLGSPATGTALAAVVASLALLAAASGFCAGCEIYPLSARLRGISPTRHRPIQPSDFRLTAGHG